MSTWLALVIRRLEVTGNSMSPTYREGERLTALRRWRRIRPGDVVAVRDPRHRNRFLLKRCVARHGRRLDVRGDNPGASTDSREFGWVATRDVLYIVIAPRRPAPKDE